MSHVRGSTRPSSGAASAENDNDGDKEADNNEVEKNPLDVFREEGTKPDNAALTKVAGQRAR